MKPGNIERNSALVLRQYGVLRYTEEELWALILYYWRGYSSH